MYAQAGTNGKGIENEGEVALPLFSAEGVYSPMTYQVADVRKPLTSVSRLCDEGNRVVFCRGGGIIQNLNTAACTPFWREGNIYILNMWIDLEPSAVFPRQS